MNRHYRTLEVEYDAPFEQVKQAYYDLVRVWHPDKYARHERLQKLATEKLTAINEAYRFIRSLHIQNFIEDDPVVEGEPIDWSRRHSSSKPKNMSNREKTEKYKPFITWGWYKEVVGASVAILTLMSGLSSNLVADERQHQKTKNEIANSQFQQLLGFHLCSEAFTVGSTREEVIAIQGKPNQEVLKYGKSEVVLENNCVSTWLEAPSHRLHVKTQRDSLP